MRLAVVLALAGLACAACSSSKHGRSHTSGSWNARWASVRTLCGLRSTAVRRIIPSKARRSALQKLVRTFFGGSTREAVAALIEEKRLGSEDLDRLQELIDLARKEGR